MNNSINITETTIVDFMSDFLYIKDLLNLNWFSEKKILMILQSLLQYLKH